MARRQGALGSPVQLRRSADGDRGLPGGRRRGPPPRDDGSGDCRLPPGRGDEPRGTRAVVPTPGRPESRVAHGLSKGLKSGDFLPRPAGARGFVVALAPCAPRLAFDVCGLDVAAMKLVYLHEDLYTVTKIAPHELGFCLLVELNSEFPTPDSEGYRPSREAHIRVRL